jgi:hypothetical protein
LSRRRSTTRSASQRRPLGSRLLPIQPGEPVPFDNWIAHADAARHADDQVEAAIAELGCVRGNSQGQLTSQRPYHLAGPGGGCMGLAGRRVGPVAATWRHVYGQSDCRVLFGLLMVSSVGCRAIQASPEAAREYEGDLRDHAEPAQFLNPFGA